MHTKNDINAILIAPKGAAKHDSALTNKKGLEETPQGLINTLNKYYELANLRSKYIKPMANRGIAKKTPMTPNKPPKTITERSMAAGCKFIFSEKI